MNTHTQKSKDEPLTEMQTNIAPSHQRKAGNFSDNESSQTRAEPQILLWVLDPDVREELFCAAYAHGAGNAGKVGPYGFAEKSHAHVVFNKPAMKMNLWESFVGKTAVASTISSSRPKAAISQSSTVYEDAHKIILKLIEKASGMLDEDASEGKAEDGPDETDDLSPEALKKSKKSRGGPENADAYVFNLIGQEPDAANTPVLKDLVADAKKMGKKVSFCVTDDANTDMISNIVQPDDIIRVRNCVPDDDALMAVVISADSPGAVWASDPDTYMVSLVKGTGGERWRQERFIHDDVDSRYLLRMFYIEDMTVEQLGMHYGVDKSTISRRLSKLPEIRKHGKK